MSYRRNLLTDRYDYLSPATRPVLGIDPETLWGLSIERLLERIHPDDRDRVQAAMVRGQEQGRGGVEYRFRGDDGRYRWVGDHFTVQRDAAGTPVTRIGIVRDLSVRKALEAERDRERALLETVLEALPTGVLIADAEGRIIRDNPAARELWGVPPETGSWREYGEWVAWWPGTGERIRAEEWALSRAILEGEETRNELVQNQPFGGDERRHYLNNVTPLRDGEGRIIGGVAAMLDVTERLAAERELRDAKERAEAALARAENAEQRLRTVFEEAPVVLAVLEGPGHVIRIQNEAHRALFGGRSGVGIPVAEALPELEEQGFRELLDRVYRTGERYVGHEIRGRIDVTGTGGFEERYFNFVNEPLRDREGAVTGILSVAVDVTESVRARQAAEVASRAKTQFFSVMSHEIRTPLNAVLGYTNLLRDGVPDEPSDTQRKYLDRIAASGSHLLTLINDVLDLAKIEAGRLRVRLERILLGGVLHEAVSVAEPLLRGKGLAFELRPSGEPLEVWGDESRIRQVLVNLLSNAAKFTERGQVRLQVRVHAERPEAAELPGDGPWV
ncbi:MAG: PAS domain-containing protein, partial [Gemmatimonadota bacterium]